MQTLNSKGLIMFKIAPHLSAPYYLHTRLFRGPEAHSYATTIPATDVCQGR